MATTVTPHGPHVLTGGPGNGGPGGHDGHGGDGHRFHRRPVSLATCRLGVGLGLASITMLFLGLTSAYVFRQGLSTDWEAIAMPPLLLVNAAVLVVSSFTIEMARRSSSGGTMPALRRWLFATLVLGLVFLCGQVLVWLQLSRSGIYLGTNPHSSFFYLLTVLHGIHLAGGVVALAAALARSGGWQFVAQPAGHGATVEPSGRRWVEVIALYWHFMDGLWIYLVVLLFVGTT